MWLKVASFLFDLWFLFNFVLSFLQLSFSIYILLIASILMYVIILALFEYNRYQQHFTVNSTRSPLFLLIISKWIKFLATIIYKLSNLLGISILSTDDEPWQPLVRRLKSEIIFFQNTTSNQSFHRRQGKRCLFCWIQEHFVGSSPCFSLWPIPPYPVPNFDKICVFYVYFKLGWV